MNRIDTFKVLTSASYKFNKYMDMLLLPNSNYEGGAADPRIVAVNKFIISSYMILATKEEIIEKKEKYEDNLLFSIMNEAADELAERQPDNSYKMGEASFVDPADLVSKIRNKIAHGDYELNPDEETVTYHFEDGDATLPIEKMVFLARYLLLRKEEYRKVDEYNRTFAVYATPFTTPSTKKVITDLDFEKFFDSYYVVTFNIKTDKEHLSKDEYIEFEKLKQEIQNKLAKKRIKACSDKDQILENVINPLVKQYNYGNHDAKLEAYIQKPNADQRAYLKSVIKGTIDYTTMDVRTLAYVVSNLVIRAVDDSFNQKFGVDYSSVLLNFVETMGNLGTDDFYKIMAEMAKVSNRIDITQDTLCMSLLYRFLSLSYAVENYTLPVDKFDLSKLQILVNNYQDGERYEITTKCTANAKKIIACKESINKTRKNIKGMKKSKNADKLKDKIKDQKKYLLFNLKNLAGLYHMSFVDNYHKHMIEQDRIKNEKYNTNKMIIEAIRNSLSHGNVKLIPTDNLETTVIELNDVFEGKLTFSIRCTYSELRETMDSIMCALVSDKKKIRTR